MYLEAIRKVKSGRAKQVRFSMNLDIILRTCDRVDAFTGPKRIVGPKSAVVVAALGSILRGLDPSAQVRLYVVDDQSSEETLDRIRQVLYSHKRRTPGFDYQLEEVKGSGNGDSLKTCFELARQKSQELIYFVEDDYIHEPDWLKESLAFYQKARQLFNKEVILHPYDCPDRYIDCYLSYVLLGQSRHWRQIDKTTCTFLIHRSVLEEFWDRYMHLSLYGKDPSVSEDNTINPIYRMVPCFSPIPTLAVHMQYEWTISPFVDPKTFWEKNK